MGAEVGPRYLTVGSPPPLASKSHPGFKDSPSSLLMRPLTSRSCLSTVSDPAPLPLTCIVSYRMPAGNAMALSMPPRSRHEPLSEYHRPMALPLGPVIDIDPNAENDEEVRSFRSCQAEKADRPDMVSRSSRTALQPVKAARTKCLAVAVTHRLWPWMQLSSHCPGRAVPCRRANQ